MATTENNKSTIALFSNLSQLHFIRQIVFLLMMAAAIALGTAVVMWSREGNFTPLYMSLSPADSSEIVTTLQQLGVRYKLNTGSGVISVPASEMDEVRLQLASQGLPRNTSIGYEILGEDQSLSTSNFMEQARFNHALEQELVRTIRFIRSVRDARVHLSIPKQNSFIRDSNKPSASVMLNVVDGQAPGSTQLAGIVHLVASSVSGLTPENVSIVDQYGNLLSKSSSSEFEQSSEHLKIIREVEDDYTSKILDILSPVVGAENIRAQVSADIDFTSVETTSENYDPNAVVVRSEQTQEERAPGSAGAPVQPGTLTAFPPDLAQETQTSDLQTTRINSTRNYEVDHSISYSRNVPGRVNRISVAVLVDLDGPGVTETAAPAEDGADTEAFAARQAQEAQRLERLTQLVRDTIGFNQDRGDSVNVISEQFAPVAAVEFEDTSSILDEAWVIPLAKQVLAGVFVIFLIFGIMRPILKSAVTPTSNLPNRAIAGSAGALTADGSGAVGDDGMALSGDNVTQLAPKKSKYDQNLALAQQVVQSEPVRAARMIKEWVANG